MLNKQMQVNLCNMDKCNGSASFVGYNGRQDQAHGVRLGRWFSNGKRSGAAAVRAAGKGAGAEDQARRILLILRIVSEARRRRSVGSFVQPGHGSGAAVGRIRRADQRRRRSAAVIGIYARGRVVRTGAAGRACMRVYIVCIKTREKKKEKRRRKRRRYVRRDTARSA